MVEKDTDLPKFKFVDGKLSWHLLHNRLPQVIHRAVVVYIDRRRVYGHIKHSLRVRVGFGSTCRRNKEVLGEVLWLGCSLPRQTQCVRRLYF